MNPYDHARSSARDYGGRWEDYHALHAWFDSTKATHCHFSHRSLHHHFEGMDEAIAIFGPIILNADGVYVFVHDIARQHIEEDCAFLPRAADWLLGFDMPEWFRAPAVDPSDLAEISARRFGGTPTAYLALHSWFMDTRHWVDGPAHLFFRHHAFGIYEAEHRFGPVLDNGARGAPTRVVAERHVRSVLGRLPAAPDLLRRLKAQRWMLQATSATKSGLA